MGDRDARIAGFCAEFDGGRDGRGPGSPKPLKKIKIAVFRGPGSRPDFPYNSLLARCGLVPIGPVFGRLL